MIRRVLIANRGEIAVRIIKTCQRLGIQTVIAVSSADAESLGAQMADVAVRIGPARATESYLRPERLIESALHFECDALHPGYGFLSEDPALAELCTEHGITFIGPSPGMLRLFGDKVSARRAAIEADIPVGAGTDTLLDDDEARVAAEDVGYPVMLKAALGGGGKGMRIARSPGELAESLSLARTEAEAAFGSPEVFLERWVENARHIEVQIAAAPSGEVIHLGDRDCTLQRRNQKLVEEAPAPHLDPEVQEEIRAAAVTLCRHAGYDGIGTVEFLYDVDTRRFSFLEVNPRIQVEHGVTEMVTGLDIVELQLRIAETGALGISQDSIDIKGSAIECRINAENPAVGFRASPGRITEFHIPQTPHSRTDTHCFAGYFMPPYYDSLLAKVMAWGEDRPQATDALVTALGQLTVVGVATTRDLGVRLLTRPEFTAMEISTRWLDVRTQVDDALLTG